MIKYIGKKHLDSNFYRQIILQQENGFVKVRTLQDKKVKNITLIKTDVKCITEQVKNLDDYHKLEEIVLYFLRNNTICEISQESDEVVVVSTSGRKLILNLSKEYNQLLGHIINKYNKDRLDYIDNCNQKRVYIRTTHLNEKNNLIWKTSNYFEGHEQYKEEQNMLVLTLAKNKKGIAIFDKVFIMEYIKELLQHTEKTIIYFNKIDGHREYGIEVWIDDKKIHVPEEIEREVKSLILNRNEEIKRMNQKQYKLEGII